MKIQNSTNLKSVRGFTLIETILYLALFSIIIGGGMIVVFQIIQSTDASQNQIILQEEANFILRKIDNSLSGATTVTVVSTPPSLTITKSGSLTLLFAINSTNITLKRNSGSPTTLNSSSILISNLSFVKNTSTGKPDSILTTFTLTTKQNGRNTSQIFTTTKYLRK